ncbi:SMC-Scp complex subunit ScpB [Enterococcus italicus]|uniref:Segregation and condensation protein B n=1 Tax=Enterococcus italicus (strain DSM 15952 / CCUG 50447 / LMG 22039 / TP 1.5) TaxID=888064 RepID=E6LF84_ENTI1|nr:SMC-Scp complex subunit ScpB [Enterococcus italicus]EFU74111.1 segregation and condensation protein B [Enterococcus italicus DSM 15952]
MRSYCELEALLFIAGQEGIGLDELSYVLKEPTADVFAAIQLLNQQFEEDSHSPYIILELGNQFVLSTKKELSPLLKEYAQSPLSAKLSQAALETLAIIAYKQPVTRTEIETIRGVKTTGSIQKLIALQFIQEMGRADGPGRAILYGTTEYFMNYFGIKNLTELPDLEQMSADLADDSTFDLFDGIVDEELDEGE